MCGLEDSERVSRVPPGCVEDQSAEVGPGSREVAQMAEQARRGGERNGLDRLEADETRLPEA